jgi:hypothetical protein
MMDMWYIKGRWTDEDEMQISRGQSNRLCPNHTQTPGQFHELTWAPALMLPQGQCHYAPIRLLTSFNLDIIMY